MSKKKLSKEEREFLSKNRFTAPFKCEVVGKSEVSEEERKEAKEFLKRMHAEQEDIKKKMNEVCSKHTNN